jgi:hypothetical protein
MTSSEDRWVNPADGEDPREADRAQQDGEAMAEREATRQVSHDQDVEREQDLSADRPGADPSNRDRDDQGQPTAD